jgi:hypothetical protein
MAAASGQANREQDRAGFLTCKPAPFFRGFFTTPIDIFIKTNKL